MLLESVVEDHDIKEKLMRMTDYSGDTALHKTLRSQHLDIVKLLVKEDPEFECPANHVQETPLYLAAESDPEPVGVFEHLREVFAVKAAYKRPLWFSPSPVPVPSRSFRAPDCPIREVFAA
ncbi:hypothetical protein FXO38_27647 [Capsicum annuum]|nr:hypothetical protein FXO38_27647 [Capsicum annuum]KAF3669030.1 hypothetical protein FXO37_09242 [Capsicum annuum]